MSGIAETLKQNGVLNARPLASYLAEEMQIRKWTAVDVAKRMSGNYSENIYLVNFILAVTKENISIDDLTIANLAKAFSVSFQYFKNLHQTWLDNPSSREEFECPEEILDGLLFPSNDHPST